jgi:hypothetical protein
MKTEHLTYKYPQHYCINIVSDEENVLLTADMSLDRIPLLQEFTRREHSSIFVSHIYLWHKKWMRQLGELGYTHTYFYHLPSDQCDWKEYRKKGIIYWEKHGQLVANSKLLGYNLPEIKKEEVQCDISNQTV